MTGFTGRILRMPQVVASVGLSQATINRLHRAGDFPRKVELTTRARGWREADIEEWKAARALAPSPA